MGDAKQDRWVRRLERAAALIAERLDDPPPLQELAAAAAVSPFHFHRIWRALTGETVGQTVLRLRMEASQDLLERGGGSVTEVAMAVGFGTPQSFARAFKRHTGRTPSEHRSISPPAAREAADDRRLAVEVEVRGEVLTVALRRTGGPYQDLNATFAQVWSWAEANGVLGQLRGIYGIPLDDPLSVPDEQLRYDACLDLGIGSAPAPFRVAPLPVGDHARLRHLGPYEGLEDAAQFLIGDWLLRSGREPADFPIYHQFLNDPDETPAEELVTDILLPLAPRAEPAP